MLRTILLLLFFFGCSTNTTKKGGQNKFRYNIRENYSSNQLSYLSKDIIESSFREPPFGKYKEIFGLDQTPIKKIGIIVFESILQPTRSGLSGHDLIYLSAAGKQIITENLHTIWDESFQILVPEIKFLHFDQIMKSKAFRKYGTRQTNYVKVKRELLGPDDIFYLEPGKETTTASLLNSRGAQDLSFLLVPAYELMGGPKWSEHNKHFVNDLAKEHDLDAVIIVLSEISWNAKHWDKNKNAEVEELAFVRLSSSLLLPLSDYNKRLKLSGDNRSPDVTLCFKTYNTEINFPINISSDQENKNFDKIEYELIGPILKGYKDLAQMMIMRMSADIKETWK